MIIHLALFLHLIFQDDFCAFRTYKSRNSQKQAFVVTVSAVLNLTCMCVCKYFCFHASVFVQSNSIGPKKKLQIKVDRQGHKVLSNACIWLLVVQYQRISDIFTLLSVVPYICRNSERNEVSLMHWFFIFEIILDKDMAKLSYTLNSHIHN